jgi:hypothetical protein
MNKPNCYNRKPYSDGCYVQDGYWPQTEASQVIQPKRVFMKNNMSRDCRQEKTAACLGCCWNDKGEATG